MLSFCFGRMFSFSEDEVVLKLSFRTREWARSNTDFGALARPWMASSRARKSPELALARRFSFKQP
jgi:hypothetical protein